MLHAHGSAQSARFGPFEVDFRAGELLKNGRRIRLQDQPLQVLAMLLEHPGNVVTRDKFRQKLWPNDTFVDFDHGLNNAINRLREALCDSAETPRFIETLPRRGYRFIGRVEGDSKLAPATPAAKPSVAVLPFQNLSIEPKNEYFSDGMTEEITNKLSNIRKLEVASRTSMSRFKGAQKDIKEIGQELGVRYLLEGSVRKAGSRVRIAAQLIDCSTGFHLWAEEFDRELKDVFAVQKETALKITEALNLRLGPEEQQALRRRYTDNAEAYDAYLRGRALIEYYDLPEKMNIAQKSLERALQLDPEYVPALAGLSRVESQSYRCIDPSEARLQRAEQLAEQALALDPEFPDAHVAIGAVHGFRYEYARAAERFRHAIGLERDNPYAWGLLAWALSYLQPPNTEEAEKAARESIPLEPTLFSSYYQLGRALLVQGRYGEAVGALEYAKALNADFTAADFGLALVSLARGDYRRALAQITGLARYREVPIGLVLISSIYAATGEKGKALASLEKALARGYRDFAAIDASPYLAAVRPDPAFQQLLSRYRHLCHSNLTSPLGDAERRTLPAAKASHVANRK